MGTIIEKGQGYEIYCSDTLGSVVPYAPDKKVDGQDHGFKDLRDRPHLVKFIPEVSTSEGLAALLRARGFNNGTSQNKNCAFYRAAAQFFWRKGLFRAHPEGFCLRSNASASFGCIRTWCVGMCHGH